MLKERLISGVILVLIAVGTFYAGGWLTFGVVLAISLIGQFEFLRAMGQNGKKLCFFSYALTVFSYLALAFAPEYAEACPVFALLALMACYVCLFPRYTVDDIMAHIVGFLYVSILLSYLYRIRMLHGGGYLIVLVFLASWGSDTLAYCAGRLFGRHPMTPVLSPKKTIEGGVGGVVGAALLGLLYALFIRGRMELSYNPVILFPLICLAGAFLSMAGDLAASAIKRNREIKDYGRLIPGHGGILDRFDSILFTAPVVYYLAVIIGGHTV